ncbi:helicase-associated domain-containing protein [Streptomyces sp. DSM 41529]|uniref:Helicase-associated domain-containing protein n=1 Tax=Streptomyces lonegramiae TaxID=3075524 RepID=A0ABU2XDR5_9ACTN|nr:helicase-associated domain-containing protein [Streptomyces sp. DSM 41529]MDT0544042.1 helicase-associated domain-containing protein [Streptomyces sp. DSM 41529]
MTSSRNREAHVPAETGSRDSGRGAPRTLAEELRTRRDDALATLLRARPDLLSPVPGDLTQLATRAGTRASVVRAVERLDRFALQTAEALAVAPDPCPYETLSALMAGDSRPGDPGNDDAAPSGTTREGAPDEPPAATREQILAELPRAVATLRAQALAWGGDDRLRLVRTARELLAPSPTTPSPTGLGPTVPEATAGMSPGRLQEILAAAGLPPTHDPVTAAAALTSLFGDRPRMAALLAGAPAAATAVLTKLTWGPPYGEASVAAPSPPVEWLLARGLLLPSGSRNVVLPREVALHLRGGRAHRAPEPLPPPLPPAARHDPQAVDATAAGQAYTSLATVEELLGQWGATGPAVLRAGGLSVRDLKRTAAALDATEPLAAFWIELAYAAGLVASDGETDERYVPTPAYDDWLGLPAEERWARLASAWLTATRAPGLVGGRDAKGRTLAALGPELDRSPAPEVRRRVLELLAALPPGASPAAESLLARLRWERPAHRGAPGEDLRSRLAQWTLTEAELLGVTGRGALSAHARALLGPLPPAVPAPAGPAAGGAENRRGGGGRGTAPQATEPGGRAWSRGTVGQGLAPQAAEAEAEAGEPGDRPAGPLAAEAEGRAADRPAPGSGGRAGAPAAGGPEGRAADRATGTRPGARRPGPATPAGPGAAEPQAPPAPGRPLSGAEAAAAAAAAARLLAPLLPQPLDHVLLQADLTAVAPGPLERPLAAMLGVLADVESKGGATVYRFTPASVRRALDAGRAASDLHAFLAQHSRTPVPQPLAYLIDDVARKHGRLRVGAASAYVRCDDDALLAEILADRRSAGLRLRRLAPTVLAAQAAPDALLEGLRAMGYAPAAESAEGDVLITRAEAHRTPPRSAPAPVPEGPPVPDETLLGAAVRAIRAGDRAATAPHKPVPAAASSGSRPPRTTSADTLATMQAAALTGSAVWIGYVNADGAASQRVIAPVRVEGGFVTAYDHTADEVRTYPLHRITGVAELADDSAGT